MRKGYKRHLFFWNSLGVLGAWFIKDLVNFKSLKTDKALPDKPFIIVSNHCTDFDPILLGSTLGRHTYFVASEHIFTKGFTTKVLTWLFDPIPIRKGGTDLSTVLDIKRRLKAGCNICIFPEGQRNFYGETEEIKQSTGKLVKSFGADLVTFIFRGGYLSTPRWAVNKRRGNFTGGVVNTYSSEQLSALSAEEVNRLIEEDIYENDFDYQEKTGSLFKGKKRAESIEKNFFVCPKCGKFFTMESKGDYVYCGACDFKAEFGTDGHLHGEDLPVTRLDDWNRYQMKQLDLLVADPLGDYTGFSDDNVFFAQTLVKGKRKRFGRCTVSMDDKQLTVRLNNPANKGVSDDTLCFPLESMGGMSQCGKKILVFSYKQEKYELTNARASMRKYEELYKSIMRKEG